MACWHDAACQPGNGIRPDNAPTESIKCGHSQPSIASSDSTDPPTIITAMKFSLSIRAATAHETYLKFAEFPRELREKIIELACTDDGTAGCSLSLVSRAVRFEAKPFRYQYIGLRGGEQVRRFASFLDEWAERERIRICEDLNRKVDSERLWPKLDPLPIRHLVISEVPSCKLWITDLIPARRQERSLQVEEYNRSCEEERQRRRERFLVNFKKITTMLGQSLYTLEVNLDSYSTPRNPQHNGHYLRKILFHQLTSLTIDCSILHQLERNRGIPFGNPVARRS